MGSHQRDMVAAKVEHIGPARCDICECERPECLEIPFGFFGFITGHICSTCVSEILKKCGER